MVEHIATICVGELLKERFSKSGLREWLQGLELRLVSLTLLVMCSKGSRKIFTEFQEPQRMGLSIEREDSIYENRF